MDFPSLSTGAINSSFEDLNPLLRSYEREWVHDTCRILEEEDEESGKHVPVSIFAVPKTLMYVKQDAYIPQIVAIGPYHQKRPDLYQMMRYKISSAKRIQKLLKTCKFREVVEHLYELEHRIRAYYHKFIDYSGETLAWTMAIDASFLLEYLQIYAKTVTLTKISYSMWHLLDHTGRKSGHQAVLRDMIMMENQIPLFVLREFLGFCQLEKPNEFLAEGLNGLCREFSPFKFMDNFPSREEELFERAHLLELLYYTIVPSSIDEETVVIKIEVHKAEKNDGENEESLKDSSNLVLNKLCNIMSAPIHYLKKAAASKKFSVILKLPCRIIKHTTTGTTAKIMEDLIDLAEEVAQEEDTLESEDTPLNQEIQIPSVTELKNVGIKFRPSKGGLNTIKFDKAAATFDLPTIVMNEKSEVVMRNLVVFEASVAPEMMAVSRYTELINGIIDTEEDVKLLREAGIIYNHLKSDMEVANLWNSMSKSVKSTKVPILDDAIKSINAYYSSQLKVKAGTIIKNYVSGSWKFLVFLGANIILLLTALEAVCSVIPLCSLPAHTSLSLLDAEIDPSLPHRSLSRSLPAHTSLSLLDPLFLIDLPSTSSALFILNKEQVELLLIQSN
ncbi:putative UPF0481 protein [Cinnamomum micranthum f. kanehirae]|uniref:Putative UPF0481 protein n=1 Tax=Cinnamomum micranthum f. kanehirae TaxID=337451 RepID=A0A3S3MS76_9MAGN|nr:putative UPF0481 protein [Cinnamomum micranthum f. kanehirae]